MTVQQSAGVASIFTEAMTRLVSGVAVVTSSRPDGTPCGLLVSSICSYSLRPPSVLVSVARQSRSYPAVTRQGCFGVHLLGVADRSTAQTFAGRGDDKFAGLDWCWDDRVPRLRDVPVYLRCRRSRVFEHGDHAIVIGEVTDGRVVSGEPLVYYRRVLDWRLGAVPDAT
ncbi:flavin reductase family protein [Solwaraspora sp. WMMD406]|uniref:flavin reductase family protein n=1 Tax=Solwaraspora sp. WMMD406 TaxID=3016095 RepID=UPI0024167FF5|nr:flavin reductase family protein [Solwaraspora sp. WMMD406]MDG4763989.1 flavin reductase family protein [Solwaraspora sp. WMMD406]